MLIHRPVLVFAATALAALSLTGCSVQDVLSNSRETEFASYEAAVEMWPSGELPGWIPTDATGIRSLETKDGRLSVIRVSTSSPLEGECEERPREGVPVLTASWTAAADRPDVVTVCDDYEIMPVEGGWLGWFEGPEEPSRLAAEAG
ncbi:hypothetical protein [Mycetocola zhadangensis]|uniref:Lipoprotein n=1 Tax=Mycetocola zhadangensis TaxID=1164595 RepID=A0A3L7J0Y8_9MICO|nr:hypothetical protein [Mycetocola zhadangensis]RLQ84176.1 hypothetical protein D9V28_08090 [Mycetocola zhadangensis]GGE95444.1 hypothetical protein GCM10011313_18050 [Mycetocola zhadangensis]